MFPPHRAGLTTIIIPKSNAKDIDDIPRNIRRDLQFILAEHMDEVLKVALTKALPKEKKSSSKPKGDVKKSGSFQAPRAAS